MAKKRSNALLFEKNQLISQQKDVISDMNRQLEKRVLRAQMNPHFIFNSLSSIQHLISSDDKKGALTYLSKFSKLLRQVLESSVNITLVLKEEIELLKIYVELEALRFDHSFSYSFDIDKNLDLDKYEIPMLLVQPYIENAIIHGLMPKTGDKKLTVSFKDIDNYIECIIEDNGVGITKPKKKEVKNISRGMSITGKRINALKKFSDQELVKVEDLNTDGFSGTKVTILIPKG
ncbi:MAG: sensor histidine kinase [Flagellimonas sp.]